MRDHRDGEPVLKPKTINIVCAHPNMVCWAIGAMLLDVITVGDGVLVLVGPHKGEEATVWRITIGQGGQPVLKLDLSPAMKGSYEDLFDECSVLKIRKVDESFAQFQTHSKREERINRIDGIKTRLHSRSL